MSERAGAAASGDDRPGHRAHSRLLHVGPLVRFGRFDVEPGDPEFAVAGRIGSRHHLVFPGTAVGIRQQGQPPFVADPNLVVLYNRHQPYERRQVSDEGDRCYWADYRDDTVLEALDDVRSPLDPDRPFPCGHVPGDDWSYLVHRVLASYLEETPVTDGLAVEETLLGVLEQVTARLAGTAHSKPRPRTARDLAEQVKGILNLNLSASLGLDRIADALGVSPYHLCRTFRAATGTTVHRYRTRLRLRAALRRLGTDRPPLSDLAAELGFSSHSHFSAVFRRYFGLSPRQLRDRASAALLEDLLARVPG